MDTLHSVAHLQKQLGDEAFNALISSDNTAVVREFAKTLVRRVKDALLALVGTVTVLATSALGKASELFKKDTSDSARVKISFVGSNFFAWFGEMLVGPHSGSTLSYHELRRNAYDRDIHAALGGEDKCVTSLAEIWWLMSQQPNGESGVLLANGYANVFYIYDGASALRAVCSGGSSTLTSSSASAGASVGASSCRRRRSAVPVDPQSLSSLTLFSSPSREALAGKPPFHTREGGFSFFCIWT